jgi:hypothetical protein
MAVSEEQLAAAIMAKITGMNLKKIDDSSITQVTPGMQSNRLDPMSFVKQNIPSSMGPTPQQLQQIDELNRRAAEMYPLPQADLTPVPQLPPSTPPPGAVNLPYVAPAPIYSPQPASVTLSESILTREDIVSIRSQLEKTNATLTKMSGMLGKVFASFTEKSKLKDSD